MNSPIVKQTNLQLKTLHTACDRQGIATSRADAKRQVEGGGIYINNRRVQELDRRVTLHDTIDGQFLVLRKGKKSYHLARVVG